MEGSQGIDTCKGVRGTGLREETSDCHVAVAEASADAHGSSGAVMASQRRPELPYGGLNVG